LPQTGKITRRLLDSGLMVLYRMSGSVAGIVVYAVGMRNYGPAMLGKYAYATTVVQLLAPLLVSGIDPMLVRELVRRPNDTLELLGSAFFLVLVSTAVAVVAPLLYVLATDRNDPDLIYMLIGLSVGLLPNCALVLLSFFRAQSRITLLTICGLAGVVVGAACRVVLVLRHAPLYMVTAVSILDPMLCGIALLLAYRSRVGSVTRWRISKRSVTTLFHLSWSGVLASFVVTIFFRLTHLMLKSLGNFEELGFYAVAFQMFSVLNFLPSAVLAVVYPKLVALHQTDQRRYRDVVRTCYVAATAAGAAILVLVWLTVSPAIGLLFGAKSLPAAPVAVAMALANLFTFTGAVRSQVIYIEHRPLYHVYTTLLGLAVLIPVNLVLIPRLGAVGAAMGVAAACFMSAVASSWIFPALRSTGLDQALAFFGVKRRAPADVPGAV
jgi:O-antigen/teichoic acid export membrane protein